MDKDGFQVFISFVGFSFRKSVQQKGKAIGEVCEDEKRIEDGAGRNVQNVSVVFVFSVDRCRQRAFLIQDMTERRRVALFVWGSSRMRDTYFLHLFTYYLGTYGMA